MEGVITRAFVIKTGTNTYVGRHDDEVELVSANIYASKSSAARYLNGNDDTIVPINIWLANRREERKAEGVIIEACVIRTGTNTYVGRCDNRAKLISANMYPCSSSAFRYLDSSGDRVVGINIEIVG